MLPLRQFGKELDRGLPALPHSPPVVSAPEARLMVSWWNCEVRIWRVKFQEVGIAKPKVVARLALQGDENISSVAITRDGGLLAVATAREVKLFQLVQSMSAVASTLRIRKLELPLRPGARLVRFSPDGKWLAIITGANDISLARIIQSEDPSDRARMLPSLMPLRRRERDQAWRDPLDGPSGHYSRSITHAEFSQDGSVFAVADLAGYIDTWVTEGHEDSTAPEIDIDESHGTASDGEESDVDEDAIEKPMTFLGQRWVRNPSGHLLPRLDSAPVVLSFQPGHEDSGRPEPNGNPAVHPTRHNPHPHSQDLPDTEHRLLVVSADRRMYLFEVLAGRLSEWSRRNPPSSYPSQFRMLDLPAKGCIWDVTKEHQRIWLYGEKWLFMFDPSKDFPIPQSTGASVLTNGVEEAEGEMSKKRKRDAARGVSRKGTSGAGDAVPSKEAPVTKMRKYTSGEDPSAKPPWRGLHDTRKAAEFDDDLDDKHQTMATFRRSAGQDSVDSALGGLANGDMGTEERDLIEGKNGREVLEQRKQNPEPWWHTFKYRPILGIVPIGGSHQPLEVVLIERPSWEVDLPPRFVGTHE